MQMRKITNTRRALAVGIVVLGLGAGCAYAGWRDHPHLAAADRALDNASMQLRAAHDGPAQFGGHRARALELLQQARQEIREAAMFADHHR